MHEYSVISALIGRVEAEAAAHAATQVNRLEVAIGALSGVDAGLLTTAWELLRERSICARAALVVTPVAAQWRCRSCDRELTHGGPLRCAACGSPGRLAAGDEIILSRIEMEVDDV